jgi:hypothetical protein
MAGTQERLAALLVYQGKSSSDICGLEGNAASIFKVALLKALKEKSLEPWHYLEKRGYRGKVVAL